MTTAVCILVGHTAQAAAALPEFQVQKGFRIELVAGEDLVEAPVAMAFDENGRLFVAELREDVNVKGEMQHRGRIRLLEDKDGDGVFDSSTVYADKLASPSALACYGGGLFVAATSDILYLKDANGDGVADAQNVVFSGFGVTTNYTRTLNTTNPPAAPRFLNSFNWGLDNRIHGVTGGMGGIVTNAGSELVSLAGSDFSFDPRALTISPDGAAAQSGLSFDNNGRKFVSDFARPLRLPMYEPRYMARNPFFPRPPEMTDIVSPSTAIFRFVRIEMAARANALSRATTDGGPATRETNVLRAGWLTYAQGTDIYRGSAFPSNYLENAFIADAEARVIHREVLRDSGLGVAASRPPEEAGAEFLAARDELFHPVQIITGPDGGLYVADYHSLSPSYGERVGARGRGRIYRIVPENFKQPKPPQLGKATTYELVAALAHPNGWQRDTAARLLYERQDAAAVPLLTNVLTNSRLPLARLHALHALDGLGALTEESVSRGLRDPDDRVRARAVLLVERLASSGGPSDAFYRQMGALAADNSVRVLYQLALTLGEIRRPGKPVVMAEILRRDPGNPWLRAAVLSSLAEGGGELLALLAGDAQFQSDPRGQEFLLQLATMIGVQGRTEEEVTPVLEFIEQAGFEELETFALLRALGEGLRRNRSSLALVDRPGGLFHFYSDAVQVALERRAAEPLRIEAIRLLSVSPYTLESAADQFLGLLGPDEPLAVQSATIELLGRYANRQVATNLIQNWPALPIALQNQAVETLLGRNDRLPALLSALQEGRIRAANFSSVQVHFLLTHRDPAIRQQAARFFAPPVVKRPAVAQKFLPALALKGNPKHGREIFLARCASCHRLGGEGQTLGPDLGGLRRLGKEKLLMAILEPNAEVRPGYAASVLETNDGENRIGLIRDENLATVTLHQPNGRQTVWPRANIQFLEPKLWSLMPEGLEEGLSLQGMADLLDYIMLTPR